MNFQFARRTCGALARLLTALVCLIAPLTAASQPIQPPAPALGGANTFVQPQTFSGGAKVGSSQYLSWGGTLGSSGYGVRDNSGAIEIKNSGGSWSAPIAKSGDSFTGPIHYGTISVPTGITGYALPSTGGNVAPQGDNSPLFTNQQNRFTFNRQWLTSDNTNGVNPALQVACSQRSENYTTLGFGEGPDIPCGQFYAESHNQTGGGQVNALLVNLNSYGNKPFSSLDQGIDIVVGKYGQNSTEGISCNSYDFTALPPASFAQKCGEFDMEGNGDDIASSQYDPAQFYRTSQWYGIRTMTGYSGWPGATQTVTAGTVIAATPSGQPMALFRATTGGTTGGSLPAWPTSGTIGDGSVVWTYSVKAQYNVSQGIWFDGSAFGGFSSHWSNGIASNAAFDSAFLNLTDATFPYSYSAAIRIPQNSVIDFSGTPSPTSTASLNQHILQYSTFATGGGGLTYQIAGTASWEAANNYWFDTFGPSWFASGSHADFTGVTTGYPTAGGMFVNNLAGFHELDLFTPSAGLNVYSSDGAGGISARVAHFATNGVNLDSNATVTGTVNATVGYKVNGVALALPLWGQTSSIGGSSLAAFTCTSGTATITGVTNTASVSLGPVTIPTVDGYDWYGYVSAANTVTVKVCNRTASALTPTASVYNVIVTLKPV